MDPSLEQQDSNKRSGNFQIQIVETDKKEMSNKCSQCEYASSEAGTLKTHMKTHTGEKSNKCNLCDYASSDAGNLKTHIKTRTGEMQPV